MGRAVVVSLVQCEDDSELDAAKLALASVDREKQPHADADAQPLPDRESDGLALEDDEPLDEDECCADKLDDARGD